jgi:hypothetical protein
LKTVDPEQRRLAESLFRARSERHLELAALPIRDKIRILLELQRLANDIRKKTGRKALPSGRSSLDAAPDSKPVLKPA